MSDLLPPDSTAEDYYQVGVTFAQTSLKTSQIIAYFQKAVELDPSHRNAWKEMGKHLHWNGQYEDALQCCDRALAVDPDFYDGWVSRASALQRLQRYGEALESYDRALTLRPETDASGFWKGRGGALEHLHRYEEAIACYNRAIDLHRKAGEDPEEQDFAYTCCILGDLFYKLGRYEEAIATYNITNYWEGISEENRTKAYIALNRAAELLQSYDDLLADDDDDDVIGIDDGESPFGKSKPPAHYVLQSKGDALMEAGRYEEAVTFYWQAFELNPEWPILDLQEALRQAGRSSDEIIDMLLVAYDRILTQQPGNAKIWFQRAVLLQDGKRYEEALEGYSCVLTIDPINFSAWYNRAQVLKTLKRYNEAVEGFDRANETRLQKIPGSRQDDRSLREKAHCLLLSERYEEAIITCDQTIELISGSPGLITLPPDFWELWFWRSQALFELGRNEDAITSYDRAIALLAKLQKQVQQGDYPDNCAMPNFNTCLATLWYKRGLALSRLERWQDAIASYDQALTFDPDHAEAQYWRDYEFESSEED